MIENKLGQIFIYPVFRDDIKDIKIDIDIALNRMGICFFLITDNAVTTPQKVKSLITSIRKKSGKKEVYFGIYSGGGSQMVFHKNITFIPSNMTLGLSENPKYAYKAAKILSSELKSIGIDFVISDICNMNLHSFNKFVGTNSFGDDPEKFTPFIKEYIRGFKSQNVILIPRHFPGIGGLNEYNYDKINTIHRSLKEMLEFELKTFKEVINEKIRCIEVSDTYYFKESIQVMESAFFSNEIINFLREKLEYKNIILSSPLYMEKFKKYDEGKLIIKAFEAGCNLIILPGDIKKSLYAYNSLLLLLKKGRFIDRLLENKDFIKVFKEKKHQKSKSLYRLKKINSPAINNILKKSIQIFHGKKVFKNFAKCKNILTVAPEPHIFTPEESENYFHKAVRYYKRAGDFVEYKSEPSQKFIADLKTKAKKYEGVILFSFDTHMEKERENLGIALLNANENTLVAGINSPYEYEVFRNSGCYVAICTYFENAIQVFCNKLFGDKG
ncbi:MAG: glycoside hydrolase family 3 N-terminal domain-containing protein [Candidatus Muiribacteriota bacterium]